MTIKQEKRDAIRALNAADDKFAGLNDSTKTGGSENSAHSKQGAAPETAPPTIALPENIDIRETASRLPDTVTGEVRGVRNISLARSAAEGRARTKLKRELYKAIYGSVPAKIDTPISTHDIVSNFDVDGETATCTFTLSQAAKKRLVTDFIAANRG